MVDVTETESNAVASGALSTSRPPLWPLAVLPFLDVGLLLLASLGWPGLGLTAALLAAQIGCALYFSAECSLGVACGVAAAVTQHQSTDGERRRSPSRSPS